MYLFSFQVYIHPDETYHHLQTYIYEQTGTIQESQIILMKNALFPDVAGEKSRAGGYPKTTEDDPLFLFNKDDNNITLTAEEEIGKFAGFADEIFVEKDATQAKIACSIGHLCKKRIEKYSLACKLICDSVENFVSYLNNELNNLNQRTQHLLDKTVIYKQMCKTLQLSQQITNYSRKIDFNEQLEKNSREFVSTQAIGVQNLYKAHTIENTLKSQWENISRESKNPYLTLAAARAKTQVENLRDSWQHLVRDRATRTLTYNDQQFHILERVKITETLKRLRTLLECETYPQFEQLAENFGDWYKIAQNLHLKLTILIQDINRYDNQIKYFDAELTCENVEYMEFMKKNMEQPETKNSNNLNIVPKKTNSKHIIVHNKLKDLNRNILKGTSEALKENSDLVQKLNDLLNSLNSDNDK